MNEILYYTELHKAKGIKACPHCGSMELCMVECLHYLREGVKGFCIHCDSCGADGPMEKVELDAADAWNKRSEEAAAPKPVKKTTRRKKADS